MTPHFKNHIQTEKSCALIFLQCPNPIWRPKMWMGLKLFKILFQWKQSFRIQCYLKGVCKQKTLVVSTPPGFFLADISMLFIVRETNQLAPYFKALNPEKNHRFSSYYSAMSSIYVLKGAIFDWGIAQTKCLVQTL